MVTGRQIGTARFANVVSCDFKSRVVSSRRWRRSGLLSAYVWQTDGIKCCVLLCVWPKDTGCLQHRAVSLSAGTDRSTIRTRDQVKRSGAQTVTLKDAKQCRLNLWRLGPIRRRMGWVLAANQVRHSWSWRQSGPRLLMIPTSRARQLCMWCGSRHDRAKVKVGLATLRMWLCFLLT